VSTMERANDDQAALWNGDAGHAWVDLQEVLDLLFKPFEDQLVDAVRAESPRHVLDVGCGTGATTIAVARSLAADARCVGVDISEPMLAHARARAAHEGVPASFVLADAQVHAFGPPDFDMIISRFGVMFFDDLVRAFANLRRAARDGARLRLIGWRSPAENPFMTAAERAAATLMPNLPPRHPDVPGQFAFADRARVERILAQSGWAEVDVQPIDVPLVLPTDNLDLYLTRVGPVARVLREADDQTRARVVATVRRAFDPYVHGDQVRFIAACWTIGARAPAASMRGGQGQR
jgi:SAM-dependent methyltransferase